MEGLWEASPFTLLFSAAAGAVVANLGLLIIRRWSRRRPGECLGTLYHRHTGPTARCVWLLEELGAKNAIEVKTVTSSDSDTDPSQRCRLELVDGSVITDSVAVCLYLADLFQNFLPAEKEKAHYYSWSLYAGNTADVLLRQLSRQVYVIPDGKRDIELVTSLTQRHGEYMDMLEEHLESRDYICGKRFTAADVILGYSLFWSATLRGGQLLVNTPRVRAYLDRLKSRKVSTRSLGSTRDWLMSMS